MFQKHGAREGISIAFPHRKLAPSHFRFSQFWIWNFLSYFHTLCDHPISPSRLPVIQAGMGSLALIFFNGKGRKGEKRKPKGPIFLFSGKQNFIEFDSRWREKSATQTVKCQLNPMCSRATMAKSVVTICENSPSCHFTWLVVLELWIYAIMSFSITTGYMPKSQQYPSWTF